MDDDLLVGVFLKQNSSRVSSIDQADASTDEMIGWLMVVDTRTSILAGAISPRNVSLRLSPSCTVVSIVPGGDGGYSAQHLAEHQLVQDGNSTTVRLSLLAGGGALLRLGGSKACVRLAQNVRRWFVDPSTVNLAWNLPQSAKTDMYSRFGASERHFRPGGLAGAESNFVIGGSYDSWADDPGGGAASMSAWAQAGFVLGSMRTGSDEQMAHALGEAMAFGVFIIAAPEQFGAAVAAQPSNVSRVIKRFGCSPNLGGYVLGNSSAKLVDVAAAADVMRQHGYWQMPIALASSVPHATALSEVGVSLPALKLPAYFASTDTAPAGSDIDEGLSSHRANKTARESSWGSSALTQLAAHSMATTNTPNNQMSMVVALDPCEGSDSFLRFGAYSSMIFGAQALWWEGMERCARVGTARFELVASINRRIAQVSPDGVTSTTVTASSLLIIVWHICCVALRRRCAGCCSGQNHSSSSLFVSKCKRHGQRLGQSTFRRFQA